MIVLHQFAPKYGLPNVSPFCMKVESYLRLTKLEYTTERVVDPSKTPKGKAPYIVDGDTVVADSSMILDYLDDTHGINLDADLSETQRALSTMVAGTLEERLYFALVFSRWIDERNWPQIKRLWFADLPPVVRSIVPVVARRQVRSSLHGQGMGRHSPAEIYHIGQRDIDALAQLLGDQAFFFGTTPTRIDVTVHAFVANLLQVPLDSPLKACALQHDNLIAYCERMGKRLYPELASTHVVVR